MNLVKLAIIFLFLLLRFESAFSNTKTEKTLKQVVWGGGGAFTSSAQLNGIVFISSDVAGVWRKEGENWVSVNDGLGDYNVTALETFNNKLLAITATGVFQFLPQDEKWVSIDLKVNTYRSINDLPAAKNQAESHMCIATREHLIHCLNNALKITSYKVKPEIVKGVNFLNSKNETLYYFDETNLYQLDLNTSKSTLLKSFDDKIVTIQHLNEKSYVVTQSAIFELSNATQLKEIHSSKSKIINAFFYNTISATAMLLAVGTKWDTEIISLVISAGNVQQTTLNVNYDWNLPHRAFKKNNTKFLSIKQIGKTIWFTDYWGVYTLNPTDSLIKEVSYNAHNSVGLDLLSSKDAIYISTMDNGVIAIEREDGSFRQPRKISPNSQNGHAWSLNKSNNKIYSTISPWNNPNDYLFTYDETNKRGGIEKLTHYKKRVSRGSFWGRGYSRKLVFFNGLMTSRDGNNGGLFSIHNSTIPFSKKLKIGQFHKVYKGMTEHNGMLYVATCENRSTLFTINLDGKVDSTIKLPRGFCAFDIYKNGNTLYLLGSRKGKAEAYTLKNRKVRKLISTDKGSAFYTMATGPDNNNQIVLGTISWSSKPTSSLFVSVDSGENFKDFGCLLSHKTGIAKISFDSVSHLYLILQKVGGLIAVSENEMFTSC